jgi:acetyl-CoA acyltransferase
VVAGAYDIVIAAGVESMGGVPMGSKLPQGISAELIAAKWALPRTQLDDFSAGSHEKAEAATKAGLFDNELVPIAGLTTDEIIRPGTTVETLAGLKPAFYNEAYAVRFPQINWEITAGNSSPLSDERL